MLNKKELIGGVLLVSGTTIGAAMLALPTITGLAGFFPSIILFVFYWMLLTYSAFLMLEATLFMGGKTNIISMARKTLGFPGEAASWTFYLFLLYALTTAYLTGSSQIMQDMFQAVFGLDLPHYAGVLPLLLVFGYFVYHGTKAVDFVNRLLMTGLAIAYFLMIVTLFPEVKTDNLRHTAWKYLLISNSVIATSFGFHIIIPTLSCYLNRDVKKLTLSLLIGSFIPLIIYILWVFVSLGIIPIEGAFGIKEGYLEGENGVHLLTGILGNNWLSMIARFFSFFAIITSFLGVSLSLQDFLADGFKVKKTPSGKSVLFLLTFLPPLIIMWLNPRAFLTALEYAGAFGVMTLLVLMPALMVYKGRYIDHYSGEYQAPGGKLSLILVMIIAIGLISLEVITKLGIINLATLI